MKRISVFEDFDVFVRIYMNTSVAKIGLIS